MEKKLLYGFGKADGPESFRFLVPKFNTTYSTQTLASTETSETFHITVQLLMTISQHRTCMVFACLCSMINFSLVVDVWLIGAMKRKDCPPLSSNTMDLTQLRAP